MIKNNNAAENQNKEQYLIVDDELKDVNTYANVLTINKKEKYKCNLIGEFNQNNIINSGVGLD